MARISKDVPRFIIDMLDAVDYSRITDANYNEWIEIIRANIGKHLRLKKNASSLISLDYPIRQDFCDLLNKYDFNSLSFMKQAAIMPIAKRWANENLPLRWKL